MADEGDEGGEVVQGWQTRETLYPEFDELEHSKLTLRDVDKSTSFPRNSEPGA